MYCVFFFGTSAMHLIKPWSCFCSTGAAEELVLVSKAIFQASIVGYKQRQRKIQRGKNKKMNVFETQIYVLNRFVTLNFKLLIKEYISGQSGQSDKTAI